MTPSSATTPREPIGPERTRRQLQELDALLQQMLALPVSDQAEEPAAAESENAEAAAGASPLAQEATTDNLDPLTDTLDKAVLGLTETVTVQAEVKQVATNPAQLRAESMPVPEMESQEEASNAVGAVTHETETSDMSEPPSTDGASPTLTRRASEGESANAPSTWGVGAVSSSLARRIGVARRSAEVGKRVREFAYRGLIGINRSYDKAIDRLGSRGKVLQGAWGRDTLGVIGIILLAGAAVIWLSS